MALCCGRASLPRFLVAEESLTHGTVSTLDSGLGTNNNQSRRRRTKCASLELRPWSIFVDHIVIIRRAYHVSSNYTTHQPGQTDQCCRRSLQQAWQTLRDCMLPKQDYGLSSRPGARHRGSTANGQNFCECFQRYVLSSWILGMKVSMSFDHTTETHHTRLFGPSQENLPVLLIWKRPLALEIRKRLPKSSSSRAPNNNRTFRYRIWSEHK